MLSHLRGAGFPARHLAIPEAKPTAAWIEIADELIALLGTGMLCGLIGKRGTGKTFAVVHVGREACGRHVALGRDGRPALYRKTMDLFLDVRGTYGHSDRSERQVLEPYIATPLLALDEIQERGDTAFEDRLLNYVIDKRYDAKRDTLLISNLTRAEFVKSVGSSIVSRLTECGSVFEFDGIESFRKRKAP